MPGISDIVRFNNSAYISVLYQPDGENTHFTILPGVKYMYPPHPIALPSPLLVGLPDSLEIKPWLMQLLDPVPSVLLHLQRTAVEDGDRLPLAAELHCYIPLQHSPEHDDDDDGVVLSHGAASRRRASEARRAGAASTPLSAADTANLVRALLLGSKGTAAAKKAAAERQPQGNDDGDDSDDGADAAALARSAAAKACGASDEWIVDCVYKPALPPPLRGLDLSGHEVTQRVVSEISECARLLGRDCQLELLRLSSCQLASGPSDESGERHRPLPDVSHCMLVSICHHQIHHDTHMLAPRPPVLHLCHLLPPPRGAPPPSLPPSLPPCSGL